MDRRLYINYQSDNLSFLIIIYKSVLIDDREKLAKEWEEKGGIFVHHTSTTETLQKLENLKIISKSNKKTN